MGWVRRVLGAVLVLALLVVAGLLLLDARVPRDRLDTVQPGNLSVAAAAAGRWSIGPLQVSLHQGRGLVVREDGRTVWAAPPGEAFVTGGRGRVSWQAHRGYFWPHVGIDDRLADQRVESVHLTPGALTVQGRLSSVDRDATEASYSLTLRPRAEGGATVDLTTSGDPALTSVGLVSGRTPGAGVHGFGEQFADFDLDGRLLPIVVREQGVGRGEQPLTFLADLTNHGAGGTQAMTYAAQSTFVTDDLRGVRLDPRTPESDAFAVADMRDPAAVNLTVWTSRLRAELTSGTTPTDLVIEQQAGTVRPRLASWAQDGAIVGLQGGTRAVRRKLAVLQRAGARITGVWLQDWTGQRTTSFGARLWWTWQLDRNRYPHWHRLVRDLHRRGIHTTTYVNPWVVDARPRRDPGIRNLWQEARHRGFLVTRAGGSPYQVDQGGFSAALVDLTDRRARDWFAGVIADDVLGEGVDGFMADFGEGLPFDARLDRGSADLLHNRWPLLWAQTVQLACLKADKPDCVTWFRSGSLGSAAETPLFWNGDQMVDFSRADGLASALLGTLSAGISGWPLVHSDVGGYTSVDAKIRNYVRPSDLLERWAEYAAFGVVMRTHEGNRPGANTQVWSSTAEAREFARMTRLFAALAPYRHQVVAEATRTGVPAIRPGWLIFPHTAAARADDQFFLGSSVLVAPVLEHDADRVSVTFPPGRWVHLLTGRAYSGGRTVEVAAPVGTPAAFVRAGDTWAGRLRARVRAAGLDASVR